MGIPNGELYLGDSGRNVSMDSVRFVSRHITPMSRAERQKTIRACLKEFHQDGTTEERKKELSDTVVLQTWYLFPYILSSKNYQVRVFEEAIQNMAVNTLKAIRNFNPDKNSKFATYLSGYLKDAISGSIRAMYIINTPSNVHREKMKQLQKAAEAGCEVSQKILNEYKVTNNTDKPQEEQAENTCSFKSTDEEGWVPNHKNPEDLKEVREELRALSGVYLDEMDYSTASSLVNTESMEQLLYRNDVVGLLERVLHCEGNGVYETEFDVLNKKEKVVISYRYGVFGAPKLTLEGVADMFNKGGWEGTKEWIYQIEKKAKNKLRLFLADYGIEDCQFLRDE